MIIKEGIIGHFLAFLVEKLHFRIEYSIAGFYMIFKKFCGRTFYLGLAPYEVAKYLDSRMVEWSINL